ncbi:methyl-accepting chemotaxis protein [Thiovibrio sp. JS02]
MNWKEMTIAKKITAGFAVILALLVVIVTANYFGVGRIVGNAEDVILGNKLDGLLAQKEVDHLNWVSGVNALLNDDNVTELHVETDHTQCGFGKWLYGEERQRAEILVPSIAPLLKSIEKPHKDLHDSASAIKEVFVQGDLMLPAKLVAIEAAHLGWAGKAMDALLARSTTIGNFETDPAKCMLGKWLGSEQARKAYKNGSAHYRESVDSIHESHDAMHASGARLKELLAAKRFDDAGALLKNETLKHLNATIEVLWDLQTEAENQIAGMQKAKDIYAAQTVPSVLAVQELLGKIRAEARNNIMTDEVMVNAAQRTRFLVSVFGFVTVGFGLFLSFFLARAITSVLTMVANRMADGAEQVAAAAGQISSSSQVLAEGASEQAASVEETSASIEEVAAMTKQDAENAGQADILMKEANQVLLAADASMKKLTASMEEISFASTQTQKIVKTIDEIAFQTNLLALNAAVEAARAGEAGAGFAVVADEVRNLAMRAAEAAKNTSSLIDGTVQKINAGSDLVSETSDSFTAATRSVQRMSALVSEIAGSTSEQSRAIGQVNKAISHIDSVTQQNAANAEETASASEELNAQAEVMKATVNELLRMVGGTKRASAGALPASEGKGANLLVRPTKSPDLAEDEGQKKLPSGKGKGKTAPRETGKVKPEQVIPFEDEEFQDF